MKIELIEDCRSWYKRWSTWLAGVYATVSVYVLANPTLLLGLVDRLPQPWKMLAVGASWSAMVALPILTAQVKQKNLTSKSDGSA
jgi:ABC-type uncharacterized transport system permease subunit